jgi:signal transduction histidine kinase
VLAVPAIAFLAIAGLQIGGAVRQSARLGTFNQEIKVGGEVLAVVHALQLERDHAAGYLALPRNAAQRGQLEGQFTADGTAVARSMEALARAVDPIRSDPWLTAAYGGASTEIDGLHPTREGVRNGWLRQRAVFEQYNHVIEQVLAMLPTRFDLNDAPDLERTMRSFATVAAFEEYGAQLRGRLYAAATAGTFDVDDDEIVADLKTRQNASLAEFRSRASSSDLAKFDQVMSGEQVAVANRMQLSAVARTQGRGVGLDPAEWWRASSARLELVHGIERGLLASAVRSATDLHSVRGVEAVAITVVIVLTVAGSLLLSWTVGRSMLRSLRALRTQALDVAQHRLPDAIERLRTAPTATPVVDVPSTAIRTSDEIGEVSEAFTAVHRRAVLLAAEQAVMRHNVNAMFINLARRSQSLVERQIQLLDRLESAETDPDQLDNLFLLDHLATRMRRNDENLLVLAGGETIRRRPDPVELSAVVLAATGEIEQYARIMRDVTSAVCVVGHTVSDLVHLLAELLENATVFSPPDSMVTVTGHQGAAGDVTILISDSGIGMTPDGFTEANARVRGTADIDVAASERMGLVVVGHLAARHDIKVSLSGSAAGVIASVILPRAILSPARRDRPHADVPEGRASAAARRPVRQVRPAPADQPPDDQPPDDQPPDDQPPDDPAGAPQTDPPGDQRSLWWSGKVTDPTAPRPTAPRPAVAPPKKPMIAGTSTAGLPLRVPLAQRPADPAPPEPDGPPAPEASPPPDLDQSHVSATLSAFYSGVRRGAAEEDDSPLPLWSDRSSPDAESASP